MHAHRLASSRQSSSGSGGAPPAPCHCRGPARAGPRESRESASPGLSALHWLRPGRCSSTDIPVSAPANEGLPSSPRIKVLTWGRDPDTTKVTELKQMVVTGDDRVGSGGKRAGRYRSQPDRHDRERALCRPCRRNSKRRCRCWCRQRSAARYWPRRNSWTARSTSVSLMPAFVARPAP